MGEREGANSRSAVLCEGSREGRSGARAPLCGRLWRACRCGTMRYIIVKELVLIGCANTAHTSRERSFRRHHLRHHRQRMQSCSDVPAARPMVSCKALERFEPSMTHQKRVAQASPRRLSTCGDDTPTSETNDENGQGVSNGCTSRATSGALGSKESVRAAPHFIRRGSAGGTWWPEKGGRASGPRFNNSEACCEELPLQATWRSPNMRPLQALRGCIRRPDIRNTML